MKSDELTEIKITEEDGEITWTKDQQRQVEAIKMDSALLTARLLGHSKPLEKPDLEPLKLNVTDFWDVKCATGAREMESVAFSRRDSLRLHRPWFHRAADRLSGANWQRLLGWWCKQQGGAPEDAGQW